MARSMNLLNPTTTAIRIKVSPPPTTGPSVNTAIKATAMSAQAVRLAIHVIAAEGSTTAGLTAAYTMYAVSHTSSLAASLASGAEMVEDEDGTTAGVEAGSATTVAAPVR